MNDSLRTTFRRWAATLLACLALANVAHAATPPAEARKIEALIAAVAAQRDAVFIRNGSEHTAAQAAAHLRLKWTNAGGRIRTAEDFIRYCASKSSLTGRKYRIRFADGREVDAGDFFRAELRRIEAKKPAAAPPRAVSASG
jgi:hypothetical protein